jgi:predicted transcriptional regulator
MGRPRHQPDAYQRRQVETLAGYGIPEAEIAGLIGIDPKTLRRHYRQELDHGHTKANAKVAENLYRKATGEGREAVTAAIFWLKARARWKETNVNEIAGVPGQPLKQVHEIRRIIVSPAEREERKRERDERVMRHIEAERDQDLITWKPEQP